MRSQPPLLRALHHAIFNASRQGRAAEVAGWANAAAALAAGGAVFFALHSWPLAGALVVALFVLLRLALAHRVTVWVAAACGTLTIGAAGGGLSWLFGHVVESSAAPVVAAVIGAVASAALPGWAYARLARRRANDVRDSLVEPVSVPSSH